MKSIISAVVLVVNICLLSFAAHSDFDVRVIYFKPTDAGDIDVDLHDKMLKDIQMHYQKEMTKHSYEGYTFPLELDGTGKIVIYEVKSKHNINHFNEEASTFDIYSDNIKHELPLRFNNDLNLSSRDDVLLILLGGVPASVWGIELGMGFTWHAGRSGGVAVVKLDALKRYPNHYLALIAHELGHAFGLDPGHNGFADTLNGTLVAFGKTAQDWGNRMRLLKFEADVLKSRPIFRQIELKEDAIPEPEKPNKNPDLIEEDIQEGEDNMAIQVKTTSMKLTMTWAKVKTSF